MEKQNQKNKTDLEKAGDFLDAELKKNGEIFRINLGELLFEKLIGSGASAEVYQGSYKEMDVAIKKLRF